MEKARLNSSGQDQFRVNAVGDKLLMPDGSIKYLLFFEADEPYWIEPLNLPCGYEVFLTRNGFHVVGKELWDARMKYVWWHYWRAFYPCTDYMLHNWNWLMPHTEAELDYILKVASPMLPQVVRYYRDKAVWETYAQ